MKDALGVFRDALMLHKHLTVKIWYNGYNPSRNPLKTLDSLVRK